MPIEGEREKENFIAPAFPFWYFNFCSISCIFIPNVVLQNIRLPPPQNLNLRTLNTHTSRNGNRMQLQHPNKCLCFNFLFHAITFYFSMSWKTSSDWWCMWSFALRIHLTSRCFSFAHHSIQMLASCGKNVPYNYTQSSSITYTAIEVRNLWLSQVYRGEDIKLLSFSTRCTCS